MHSITLFCIVLNCLRVWSLLSHWNITMIDWALDHPFLTGILACCAAGCTTALGALPVLFINKSVSKRVMSSLLGFAAGIMLAATCFSLIVPSLEHDHGGIAVTAIAIILGGAAIWVIDRLLPHAHFATGPEGPSSRLRGIWLFVIAITIHNMPEGLAVGVAFGGGEKESVKLGLLVTIAIGCQNIPEGLAVALPLKREGYSTGKAIGYAALGGMVEPVMGLLGLLAVRVMTPLLPWSLAFAGGAMIYVIAEEIIPEAHAEGGERVTTAALMIGFVLMMILDNSFG